ncbi:nucleotide sugar dehydrogenase [Fusobacterium polymorphum]|uniref:nucleotide sugar dehydrogenase n=1 Tax=Fusobacterium nucleatum subsp. polymorphum TaxID=76857 RepID=UPI002B4BE0AC|nr:nucleotide sugar dehydrogenase [Fusobacterium polymorphum]WRL74202.1 nucleotide sugar dehydrogenase [Fusobacterium polymorphum]
MEKKEKIAVVGMGYVGLPLAVAFAEKGMDVIGFDINQEKINKYIAGEDPTNEVGGERLKKITNLYFTSNEEELKKARFIIVAVPTPVLKNKMPDLRPVIGATELVGRNLKKGTIVVYESTVYPGVTEEVCLPILEEESRLRAGKDFKIGYSPERINPGDKTHRVENIVKITSGMDKVSSEIIAEVYGTIIKAGIHKATSIKVAEAAKVIENSQRDINIAFVNELALIFNKIGIDTLEVLEAASTKWNFLQFKPGLVGGHCIGVDPYYLANKAEELGYHAEVILSGRKTNDNMGKFIAEKTIKKLIEAGKVVKNSHVLIMGLTFKENCPDLRNSKVEDIIKELKEYNVNVSVTDPLANKLEAVKEYGVELKSIEDIEEIDALMIAVAHNEYKKLNIKTFKEKFKDKNNMVLIDIKGILNKEEAIKEGYKFWRL